jgi:hypothetical protein
MYNEQMHRLVVASSAEVSFNGTKCTLRKRGVSNHQICFLKPLRGHGPVINCNFKACFQRSVEIFEKTRHDGEWVRGLEIIRSGNTVVFLISSFLGSILAYFIEENEEPFVLPNNPW